MADRRALGRSRYGDWRSPVDKHIELFSTLSQSAPAFTCQPGCLQREILCDLSVSFVHVRTFSPLLLEYSECMCVCGGRGHVCTSVMCNQYIHALRHRACRYWTGGYQNNKFPTALTSVRFCARELAA